MTQEEIIAMLASIGVEPRAKRPTDWKGFVAVFERFSALVAAEEREACAQVCERMQLRYPHTAEPIECAYAIRARGTKEGV